VGGCAPTSGGVPEIVDEFEEGCHGIDRWSEEALVPAESSVLGCGTGRLHGPVPNQVLQRGQWDADVATDVDEANSTLGDQAAWEANGGAEQLGSLVDG